MAGKDRRRKWKVGRKKGKKRKIQEGGRKVRGKKTHAQQTRHLTSSIFAPCNVGQLLIYVIQASQKTDCMPLNKQTVLLSILVVFGISGVFCSRFFFIEGQLCNVHLVFVWQMNLPAG